MSEKCSTSEDLYGEPFPAKEQLIIFVIDNQTDNYNCYTRKEFELNLKSAVEKRDSHGNLLEDEIICIQKPDSGQRLLYEPVVREPLSQVWLDKSVYAYQEYDKFFVYKRGNFKLASDSVYASSFHGVPYDVYSVLPIGGDGFFDISIQQIKQEMRDFIENMGKDELEQRILGKLFSTENPTIWVGGVNFQRLYNPEQVVQEQKTDELKIENESITEIPPERYIGRSIKYLVINNCPNLTTIPIINGLISILIENCERFTTIPVIRIKRLYIYNCTSLNIIPHIEGLLKISCVSTNITNIPVIDGLTELECSYNPLTSIPNIRGLKQLDCSNNPLLRTIPNIRGLKRLNCSNNPLLRTIPNIRGLKKLWCSNCPLATVPRIEDLEVLYCQGTPGC